MKRRGGRWSGPVVSALLHAGLAFVVLKTLVFRRPEPEPAVAVRLVSVPKVGSADRSGRRSPKTKRTAEAPLPSDALQRTPAPEPMPDWASVRSPVAVATLPETLPSVLAGRTEAGRKKALARYGGRYGGQAEKAVRKGLAWLASVQCKDGSWGVGASRSMTARQERMRLTGLGLLAFLAHGETPASPEYGATVSRAVAFLLKEQEKETGLFCPLSKTIGSHDDIGVYGHAISVYALAEAYGLTRLPLLAEPVRRGVERILAGQQACGGWDHRYQHAKWHDLSVTGWQIQALRAAQVAGIEPERTKAALTRAVPFVEGLHAGEGRFYYRTGNRKPNAGLDYMTGVAVLSLQLSGADSAPAARAGLRFLEDVRCSDWRAGWEKTRRNKSFNVAYEWYYVTQALFWRGGSRWTRWNERFAPTLVRAQDASGAWKPPSETGVRISKDAIYVTEFCVLSLETYYRLLPGAGRGGGGKPAPERFEFANDVRVVVWRRNE